MNFFFLHQSQQLNSLPGSKEIFWANHYIPSTDRQSFALSGLSGTAQNQGMQKPAKLRLQYLCPTYPIGHQYPKPCLSIPRQRSHNHVCPIVFHVPYWQFLAFTPFFTCSTTTFPWSHRPFSNAFKTRALFGGILGMYKYQDRYTKPLFGE